MTDDVSIAIISLVIVEICKLILYIVKHMQSSECISGNSKIIVKMKTDTPLNATEIIEKIQNSQGSFSIDMNNTSVSDDSPKRIKRKK